MLESGNRSRAVTCHEGGISRLRTLAEQEQPDVVIVEGLGRDGSELAPIEFVTSKYPQMTICMLCSQHTPEFLISAMRAGVREVLPSPVTKAALESVVVRAELKHGSHKIQRGAPKNARILAFLSCKGGAGATFLAANLGYQLAAENRRVLLIDLNLQYGDAVLTVHDRKPGSDIAELADNLSRLDASFLDASTVHVTSNFEILAAPEDPAQSLQVRPEHLDTILNLAVNHYEFIILDLSRNLNDVTIKALDRADNIFLVLQAMLPYVRNAKQMMRMFQSLEYSHDKVDLLVNRYMKNSEIDLDDLRRTLGTNRMRIVPNSYSEVAKAINRGQSLAMGSKSNPVLKAINELVESLVPKSAQSQGGLLQRLLKSQK